MRRVLNRGDTTSVFLRVIVSAKNKQTISKGIEGGIGRETRGEERRRRREGEKMERKVPSKDAACTARR